jgi:hypothetical protein
MRCKIVKSIACCLRGTTKTVFKKKNLSRFVLLFRTVRLLCLADRSNVIIKVHGTNYHQF